MLIRSQDGDVLTNIFQVTDIAICLDDNHVSYCIKAYYPHTVQYDCAKMTLGKYVNKKRALEVLQEIQNQYQYLMECKYIGIGGSSQPEFVYQMPKED